MNNNKKKPDFVRLFKAFLFNFIIDQINITDFETILEHPNDQLVF